MLRSLLRDKSGISSVIEAVLITAVGIVVAIAVMLWISGLASSFINYEKIEVVSVSSYLDADEDVFKIQINLKNNGASTRINDIFVNNVPLKDLGNTGIFWKLKNGESGNQFPIPLSTGVNVEVNLVIPDETTYSGGVLTSGVTINIALHSSNNNNYLVGLNLP